MPKRNNITVIVVVAVIGAAILVGSAAAMLKLGDRPTLSTGIPDNPPR